jgi:riboflavin biosynthesis pyrimidine reductase
MAHRLPRHPAQVVMSWTGHLDFERTRLFNVPEVPVFVLAGPECLERCWTQRAERPWIQWIPIDRNGLVPAFRDLARHGIGRLSCVGGRSVASALIDAGLVQDLYLTTTDSAAGEPGTPFYQGSQTLQLRPVLRKRLPAGEEPPIVFEHFVIDGPARGLQ